MEALPMSNWNDDRLDKRDEELRDSFAKIDRRFDKVDERFTKVDERLAEMPTREEMN
jgi:archaellum component FlaC